VTFYEWNELRFRRTHPFPKAQQVGGGVPGGWHISDRGRFNEKESLLLFHDNGPYAIQISRYFNDNDLRVEFQDQAKLAKYFEMVYGDIAWTGHP
jgi:hypothetical protein